MKTKLSLLSDALLTTSLILTPVITQISIPIAVDGESIPSLALILERTNPAVVSVAVEGTMFQSRSSRMLFVTSLTLTPHRNKFRNDLFMV